MLLLQLSEGIKITLQRTYNAVNYRLGLEHSATA